jgi:DNA (cytosine-5)-methyltransferase 1
VDNPEPVIISLASGVGMLDEAIKFIFPAAGVACFAEWEAYAAAILLARMEDKALEPAPVWCGDIGQLDAWPFLGVVDILTAGLPCQPYSLAGKRAGNSDERSFGTGSGPLPHALRIISECRPAVVFLENVPAWIRSGWFRQFGDQLSGLGYEIIEPLFVAAGDVGASHERERVFILAYDVQQRCQVARLAGLLDQEWQTRRSDADRCGTEVDDVEDAGRTEWRRSPHTHDESGRWPSSLPCGASGNIFAPGPSSPDWPRIISEFPHLAPATQSGFRVLVDGMAYVVDASRADQLRCVGNGVVALQAALAFAVLLSRTLLLR